MWAWLGDDVGVAAHTYGFDCCRSSYPQQSTLEGALPCWQLLRPSHPAAQSPPLHACLHTCLHAFLPTCLHAVCAAASEHAIRTYHTFQPQSISNVVWSFATLGVEPHPELINVSQGQCLSAAGLEAGLLLVGCVSVEGWVGVGTICSFP